MTLLKQHGLPSIGTGVKDTETLVKNTNGLVCVCRVVIGIIALAHRETGLEIWMNIVKGDKYNQKG